MRLRDCDFYVINSVYRKQHKIAIHKLELEFCIELASLINQKMSRMLIINTRKMYLNFNATECFTKMTIEDAIFKPMFYLLLCIFFIK